MFFFSPALSGLSNGVGLANLLTGGISSSGGRHGRIWIRSVGVHEVDQSMIRLNRSRDRGR